MTTKKPSLVEVCSSALFESDLVATRLTLAFAEFLWAVMLFWPGSTFDRPTYHYMSHVMSETAWGFVFLISCLLQAYIALYNHQNRDWAKVFANWNAALWVFVVGAAMLSVSPPPAAMAGEFALTLAAVWIWIKPLILDRATIKFNEDRRCPYVADSLHYIDVLNKRVATDKGGAK